MKLLRYGPKDAEKPGLLDAQGIIRDLSVLIPDIQPATLSAPSLAALASLDTSTLPVVPPGVRLGVPVGGIRKFIAIGLNYADHAREANLPMPAEPVVFMKAVSCLSGPNDCVILPQDAAKGDWEVELGVVIGRPARYVQRAAALDHIAGYVLANDVSERAFQLERGTQWDKGKGCDTFGPLGPWLVTADEVGDPQNLGMWLDLNGRRMQSGNTATMIFSVAEIVAYLSRFLTLEPGDVVITGTPPGVGMAQKPAPVFLKAGDVMRLGIDKLGTQSQTVAAWPGAEG